MLDGDAPDESGSVIHTIFEGTSEIQQLVIQPSHLRPAYRVTFRLCPTQPDLVHDAEPGGYRSGCV
jgi:hypothetical protein